MSELYKLRQGIYKTPSTTTTASPSAPMHNSTKILREEATHKVGGGGREGKSEGAHSFFKLRLLPPRLK